MSTHETDAEYQHRATMHRPSCVHCMRRAAIGMQAQGMRVRDIAIVLQIGEAAVEQLLLAT